MSERVDKGETARQAGRQAGTRRRHVREKRESPPPNSLSPDVRENGQMVHTVVIFLFDANGWTVDTAVRQSGNAKTHASDRDGAGIFLKKNRSLVPAALLVNFF
jgi:hypothetical protein